MVSSTSRKARLLIAYFSYSGNTRRIAEALMERLRNSCDVEIVEVAPTRKRSYLHWLAYSFVPDSEVEIENPEMELSRYDVVLLGFPKWTFSCPPLNRFIRKLRSRNKPRFHLFMTSGGFDEQRFLDNMTHKLTKMGCNILESLTVRRKQIQRETYVESVDSFARRVQKQLR
jgi:flavorubredoxin